MHFLCSFFFFFNDTATTEIYTLSLHDALPISPDPGSSRALGAGPPPGRPRRPPRTVRRVPADRRARAQAAARAGAADAVRAGVRVRRAGDGEGEDSGAVGGIQDVS